MYVKVIALIFLFSASTACSRSPIVRTDTVEVQVPVLVTLDPRLTAVAPEPGYPPRRCRDGERPTVCNPDLADYVEDLRAWGRGLAAQLGQILNLQPNPKEPAP